MDVLPHNSLLECITKGDYETVENCRDFSGKVVKCWKIK